MPFSSAVTRYLTRVGRNAVYRVTSFTPLLFLPHGQPPPSGLGTSMLFTLAFLLLALWLWPAADRMLLLVILIQPRLRCYPVIKGILVAVFFLERVAGPKDQSPEQ